MGCRLVLELQHTNGMHAESFSRKVRSLCGLSHWKNVIHLSGVVLLEVVARGNQGSMGGGFQVAPYTGENQSAPPKSLFPCSLTHLTHCRLELQQYINIFMYHNTDSYNRISIHPTTVSIYQNIVRYHNII